MALTLGTRLGPYEIVSAIGSGGMGEVYRATDSNLKRAVAIMPPARSLPYEFALAPDGRHIVFVAPADGRRRLWLRSLDNETITPLPATEDADYTFWSADSKSIGYFASGTLRRIDIAGGPSITLARAPLGRGGSWNGDGTICGPSTASRSHRLAFRSPPPASPNGMDSFLQTAGG